jgi:hypothetical protein
VGMVEERRTRGIDESPLLEGRELAPE